MSEPERTGSRLADACLGVLLAAMALWGAVAIIQAIWIYLCILAAVVGIGALIWWRIVSRYRGW
ncbi:hypothetical protein K8Z61_16400 [Nocardioides sp. TRM66260-LWL]|uniref:hypothetical protein n=1 Tax=Nocardioides sp. TRM66260-LWL TaxID=2874478 RepID=UPI001CC5249E|nr:hypothetical protein [Nocardioides sp. TRM66260-LWL]MBZ5736077.1 hypothetical protein [Nocardioides sp. TRM66260-LWL]